MQAYLDNNATTQPAPEVIDAVTTALREDWGNPSSLHRVGQRARNRIDLAREQVCKLLNCATKELIFTSGATEANNLALHGILAARAPRKTIITTRLEHSAVRQPAQHLAEHGHNVIWLPVSIDGLVDIGALEANLARYGDDIALVAIHWINNETGVIQPIDIIGDLCRRARIPFFTDGTQAIGKIACDLSTLPVDALSFAGHKFHGPKGVGGLFVRSRTRLVPQTLGGPHERDRRAGTENTPGIVGLGVAAEIAQAAIASGAEQRGRALRDQLEKGILASVPQTVVNSGRAPRLWNTSNLGFPQLESEAILLLLSERGVCAAAGSACSSGSLEPSPVLLAQGIPPAIAHGSVRFSISRYTTQAEIDYTLATIPAAITTLRASMPVA